MANTFLAALGTTSASRCATTISSPAKKILELAKSKGVELHLPTDAVVAPAFDADDRARTVPIDAVGDEMILDIGPATAAAYAAVIERAKTIVFNGPMGVYEKPAYQAGTQGRRRSDRARHARRRDQRRRRRRRRGGRARARLRGCDDARVDRRRRDARISRRQDACPASPRSKRMPRRERSLRRQLEDAQDRRADGGVFRRVPPAPRRPRRRRSTS